MNEQSYVNELRSVWREVRQDCRRGASELLRQALEAFAEFLEKVGDTGAEIDFKAWIKELAQLRQDMVGFLNCARLLEHSRKDELVSSLRRLRQYLDQAPEQIAETALKTLPESVTVLTNSRSSAVEKTLLTLQKADKLKMAVQMESRPACEGRDNAERLLANGIQVTFIPDAAMGYWLEQADAVLVGADAIMQNGDFLGKIGCLPLAWLARCRNVPFYVAGERLKIVSELLSPEVANQRFSGKSLAWGISSDKLFLSSVIFERVKGSLITGFMSEDGLLKPPLDRLESVPLKT